VGGILAAGWGAALAIYLTVAPVVPDADLEDIELSKTYQRQVELIGGKAALVGGEIDEFVGSLWHGQRLAYTIAALTAVVALGGYLWTCTAPAAPADRGEDRGGPVDRQPD
jgi:hypothetical protein